MTFNVRFAWVALVAGSLAAGIACSSSNNTGGTTTPTGGTVTQHISAAAGGTVTDKAGTAALTIPGGSLAGDLDITLATTAAESGTVSSVYNFGPEGTQFSKPATLVLKMPDGTSVPSGKTASLATYDGTKWAPIAGSTFADGKVSGPVAHFSKFTIVLIDGQVVLQNSCSDVVTKFAACGGNVVGTWALTDWCAGNSSLGGDPTDGGCPGYAVTADITPSGSFTFNADGTYAISALTLSANYNATVPNNCVGSGGCDKVGSSLNFPDGGTCTGGPTTCVCTGSTSGTGKPQSGTYTTSGNTITTDNGTPGEYCVKGNQLVAVGKNDAGVNDFAYVLTKQ